MTDFIAGFRELLVRLNNAVSDPRILGWIAATLVVIFVLSQVLVPVFPALECPAEAGPGIDLPVWCTWGDEEANLASVVVIAENIGRAITAIVTLLGFFSFSTRTSFNLTARSSSGYHKLDDEPTMHVTVNK